MVTLFLVFFVGSTPYTVIYSSTVTLCVSTICSSGKNVPATPATLGIQRPSFIWSLAYVMAALARREKNARMHPGSPIGFDLITALSLESMGGIARVNSIMITCASCSSIKSNRCAAMEKITGPRGQAQTEKYKNFPFCIPFDTHIFINFFFLLFDSLVLLYTS